tara:strand:+ start:564 stop:782 length:219 start_codon:yes stop_codon:yes gene_type:complete
MKRLNSKTVSIIYVVVLLTSVGWLFIPEIPMKTAFWIQWAVAIVIGIYKVRVLKLERKARLIEIMEVIKNSK